MREFALSLGDFDWAGASAGEVAVNVYTARGTGLDAAQVARVAAAALGVFERRFGPYPYRELDLHLMPYVYNGGDEHPGLILLFSKGQVNPGARYVTAHEVAHQWWYGLVGNDIFRAPWLDEAFAQYSGIVYIEEVEGAAEAAAAWEREVERRYRGALKDGDRPIGLAISDYPNFDVYYRTVYGKGAVFLRTLREQIGDRAFFEALRTYARRHRYGVASSADAQRAFEEAAGQQLTPLFQIWVYP